MRTIFFLATFQYSTLASALINGVVLDKHPDLVRLNFERGESICSGFFINPETLMTAAHCFYSYKDGRKLKLETAESEHDEPIVVQVQNIFIHPNYYTGGWSPNDVAIIKTTFNSKFQKNFILSKDFPNRIGDLIFFGAGKTSLNPKVYGRSTGKNNFVRIGSFLYSLGSSKVTNTPGIATSIAPNDSGAPVLNEQGFVIGIAAKSTVSWTDGTFFPSLSVTTLLTFEENWNFIQQNL